jgi:hypothetical protein
MRLNIVSENMSVPVVPHRCHWEIFILAPCDEFQNVGSGR